MRLAAQLVVYACEAIGLIESSVKLAAFLLAQAGAAIGACVGGPVGAAVGGIVSGVVGGAIGSGLGKMAADKVNGWVHGLFH